MPAVPPPIDAAVGFNGTPGAFFRILARGALLQLPTFGFYRFWLITEMRRHLWSHTTLGGAPFSYTGRPRELLVGFLIAAAVLVPIYVANALLGFIAEAWQAFASVPLFLIFWFFGHFALYRARAYKVSRTHHRGLRLWMGGSGLAYALRAILWDIAVVASLGLAYPWRAASLERFKMGHTHFGTLPGAFAGTGGDLFRRGAIYWLAALALAGLAALLAYAGAPGVAAAVGIPGALALYPLLVGVRMRWQVDGMRFGVLRFQSSLRNGTVFWIHLKAGLIILGFILVGVAALVIVAASVGSGLTGEITSLSVVGLVGVAIIYLALFLGFGVLKRLYIDRALWRAVADTTTASGIGVLDTVAVAGDRAGIVGEGFADALDVSGGL